MNWKNPFKAKEPEITEKAIFTASSYDAISSAMGMFTGSTIPGTMSLPRPWKLDYYALRERSWQAYTENELASAYLDRLNHFVINTGLKLQYEPSALVDGSLSDEQKEGFEKDFAVYASSSVSSLDGSRDLHTMAGEAYLNINAGGDLLVILHVVNGEIKVQHIDGRNIVDPWDKPQLFTAAKQNHVIIKGVEYDKRGREVAYYVRQEKYFATSIIGDKKDRSTTERIPAYGRSGRRMAFRPNRNNQRIGSGRGKPILTPVLQNLEITRRYKLAELLAAEVNAQLVATIEHDESSFGTNPLENLPNGGGRHNSGQAQELGNLTGFSDSHGDQLAGKVANTTGAMVTNMGRGQKLKFSDTKRPNVKGAEFIKLMNVDTSAAIGLPFEIAQMLFTASFAASRAALEMFKIIVAYERKMFSDQYYGLIARERQRLRALQGKIDMPKAYTKAILERDEFTLAAYENYKFTGVIVPHMDPVKEVKAAIERINNNLSTREQETEFLGTGDFDTNKSRLEKEQKQLEDAGLLAKVEEINEEGASNATDQSKK